MSCHPFATALLFAIGAATLPTLPGPSTWAMVLAGAGLVGLGTRRDGVFTTRSGLRRWAGGGAGILLGAALAGCGAVDLPAPGAAVARAGARCDTNADYGMTGVVHAATKRDLDDCRRGR